jgi:DNA-binding MarR family transcriptional regulator
VLVKIGTIPMVNLRGEASPVYISAMDGPLPLPLSALLSHALVAFTIEFDNEAEHRMQHRTTRHGATGGSLHAPWLTSMVMWLNCMQFVDDKGITVRELERRARTKTNLAGMLRWGYITAESNSPRTDGKRPKNDAVIRCTPGGRIAQQVQGPLFAEIEKRWRDRFGDEAIDELRESLWEVARQFDVELPDCLPILKYGLFSEGPVATKDAVPSAESESKPSSLMLPTLLSRVLLAFALEFERESAVSLAISANLLRVLDEKGVRVRDLPRLSGVSKESIAVAMGILRKMRLAVVGADPSGGKAKVARLTPAGRAAQEAYGARLGEIEADWRSRYGKREIGALRKSLERVVGAGAMQDSPLFRGLEPYPENWRASRPRPETLPYYPMVTHRGGYPDGS